ncbi:MAG: aminoacyl-tRNA hydrolase [Deltaproteobacteria bacterium]|nr:MAG: aminoacyl-tRNA hydrolase [Deltaproteobacteria bacterium]
MRQDAEKDARIVSIVGLGNPGKQYEGTRHNAGFRVVDLLAQKYSVTLQERKFRASWGTGEIEGRKVLLFKPLTFMNRSGEVVAEMLRYFGTPPAEMLVIQDDLDLPCGSIRLVRGGGAGGHRGILSLIQHLGQQGFPRLKLGIGRPMHEEPVETYVLQNPCKEQQQEFTDMIQHATEVVQVAISSGLDYAMNQFNR